MNLWKCLLLTLSVTAWLGAATGRAEEEFVGSVSGRSFGQLSVRLADGETRRVRISESTRFFNEGAPVPQRRLLPHTLVRVAPKDGAALTVTVLEAPR